MTDQPQEKREPVLSRPHMAAGYGLPSTAPDPDRTSWEQARGLLGAARNYWLSTAGPSGRPHAMPVWGIWLDEAVLFSTGRNSRKGRDLTANPEVVIHLESGDDVVILEGAVEEVTDPAVLARFADAYEVKYQFRPETADPQDATYAVRPRVAFTWLERDFVESAARWTFP
jgi:nitroimidazol reductase NimA-like FMN-containing flavoprotein (pyridoxamine 5'-phosphate oxidase superfamily)